MNPGKLNKRVELQKKEREKDGSGGFKESEPKTFATTWASIEGIGGREIRIAHQFAAELTHMITIRYRKDVDRTGFVLYRGRLFEIQYIVNVMEQNRFLELYCLEKQ